MRQVLTDGKLPSDESNRQNKGRNTAVPYPHPLPPKEKKRSFRGNVTRGELNNELNDFPAGAHPPGNVDCLGNRPGTLSVLQHRKRTNRFRLCAHGPCRHPVRPGLGRVCLCRIRCFGGRAFFLWFLSGHHPVCFPDGPCLWNFPAQGKRAFLPAHRPPASPSMSSPSASV